MDNKSVPKRCGQGHIPIFKCWGPVFAMGEGKHFRSGTLIELGE